MADDLVVREWEEHSDIWVDKAALDDEGALIEIQFPLEEHNDAIKGLKAQLAAMTAERDDLRRVNDSLVLIISPEGETAETLNYEIEALAEPKEGES